MKKFIAKVMAFIMIITAIPLGAPHIVKAAATISADPDSYLSPSVTSSSPTPYQRSLQGAFGDKALLSWSTRDLLNYTLTYNLENDRKVTVTFKLTPSGNYTVSYSQSQVGTPNYRIWYVASTGGSFMTNPNYVIDTTPDPAPQTRNSATSPVLTVEKGYGFSFMYENREISFLWGKDDMLYYSTSGLNEGNIYDFDLQEEGVGFPTVHTQAYVLTRLIVTSVPTAMYSSGRDTDRITTDAGGNITGHTMIDLGNNPNYSLIANSPGLRLTIKRPKVCNPATGQYDKVATTTDFGNLIATLDIRDLSISEANNIYLRINNILDASAAAITPIKDGRVTAVVDATATGEDVIVELTNTSTSDPVIKPSIIYNGTQVSASNASGGSSRLIKSKPTSLEFGAIYTFPKIRFIADAFGNSAIIITPYNFAGYYRVVGGSDWDRMITVAQTGEITNFNSDISVSVGIPSPTCYQILFSQSNSFTKTLNSQIIKHPPQINVIGAPAVFEIVTHELKSTAPDNSTGEVDLRLRWDIGSFTAIKNAIPAIDDFIVLQYDLQLADNPTAVTSATKLLDKIKVTITRPDPTDYAPGTITADTIMVEVEGIAGTTYVLEKTGSDAMLITPRPISQTSSDHYVIEVDFIGIDAYRLGATYNSSWLLNYPNIHFLRMVLVKKDTTPVEGGMSLYKSLTLSALDNATVPPPQDVKAFDPVLTIDPATSNTTEVSFKTSWSITGKTLSDYVRLSSLIDLGDPTAAGYAPNLSVSMNLYISQVESKLVEFTTSDLNYRKNGSMEYKYPLSVSDPDYYILADGLVFSPINGKTPLLPAAGQPIPALNVLRDGKIVRINIPLTPGNLVEIANGSFIGLNLEYLLDGLDKNQRYYICVDLVVEEESPVVPTLDPPLGGDAISPVAAVTTIGEPDVPSTEDKVPPAPVVKVIEATDTSAKIGWDRLIPSDPGESFEYQIIRLRNEQMEDAYSGAFEKIFNRDITLKNIDPKNLNKIGWETNNKDANKTSLLIFDETVSASPYFASLDAEQQSLYIYDPTDIKADTLTDNSLRPNQLYFYYVRTKKTTSSGKELYSSWAAVTVTSKPVTAPKNLKLGFEEYDKYTNKTEYDRKTEVIISFDAPVTDIAALDRGDFVLYYQIKEDGKDWSNDIPLTSSMRITPPPTVTKDGFTHFLYKISGLNPGKSYIIQVRIVDVTGMPSLYSNSIIYRTNMDQDEFDDQKTLTDWNDKLNEELDKLLKDPYYTLSDSSSMFLSWYRPSMFDSVIISTKDVTIALDSGTAVKSVYYIPSTALLAANNANKGFKVARGNLEVTIPPKAVNTPDNPIVKTMDKRIKDKEIADYYIRLTISWNDATSTALGINTTAQITYEAAGSSVTAAALEKEMTGIMEKAIENIKNNQNVQDNIKNFIRNDEPSEELIKYINDVVKYVKDEVGITANSRLNSTARGGDITTVLDAPMVVAVKNLAAGSTATGYYYNPETVGGWQQKDTVNVGTGKGIYTSTTGLYGFDVHTLSLPNIDTLPNGGTATGIVGKYGLDAYLGQGAAFNLESFVTKDKVINSVAAIMGMPKSANAYDWLKANKNITVSSRGGGTNISTQEAIYITMILYEVKANVKVSSIQIRNQAATAGIQGIDDSYKQSIKAAFELGIYTNKSMKPKDPIKLKDFIQMLTNMDSKIKL